MVKRVVAVPGDVVEMRNNQLIINGQSAVYYPHNRQTSANSEMMNHYRSPLQNFGPIMVPEDHYLMMGDNRDNSADSRVYGFVPREEIIGKAHHVLFSLDYNDYYLPRSGRFYTPLL